jgi:predicted solute-binding protein
MRTRYIRQHCIEEGNKTEDHFKNVMEQKGYIVEKTTAYDDMQRHIDFYVNDQSVDVKGNRVWQKRSNH